MLVNFSGSARGGRREAHQAGSLDHSRVVRDDRIEIVPEGDRGCDVDGVQRPKDTRVEGARGVQNAVVDGDEIDAPKPFADRRERVGTQMTHGAQRLGAQQ
jgi:hypothetical protein